MHFDTQRTRFTLPAAASLLLATFLFACTTTSSPPPESPPQGPSSSQGSTQAASPTGNDACGTNQQACVDRCKAATPDEASRQPCYNRCLKERDSCAGR